MPKLQQLQIRVSDEEKVQIQRRAAAARMDVPKWVLMQVLPPETERFQSMCGALAQSPGRHNIYMAIENK